MNSNTKLIVTTCAGFCFGFVLAYATNATLTGNQPFQARVMQPMKQSAVEKKQPVFSNKQIDEFVKYCTMNEPDNFYNCMLQKKQMYGESTINNTQWKNEKKRNHDNEKMSNIMDWCKQTEPETYKECIEEQKAEYFEESNGAMYGAPPKQQIKKRRVKRAISREKMERIMDWCEESEPETYEECVEEQKTEEYESIDNEEMYDDYDEEYEEFDDYEDDEFDEFDTDYEDDESMEIEYRKKMWRVKQEHKKEQQKRAIIRAKKRVEVMRYCQQEFADDFEGCVRENLPKNSTDTEASIDEYDEEIEYEEAVRPAAKPMVRKKKNQPVNDDSKRPSIRQMVLQCLAEIDGGGEELRNCIKESIKANIKPKPRLRKQNNSEEKPVYDSWDEIGTTPAGAPQQGSFPVTDRDHSKPTI
jgi:hypothetical protein